MRRAEQDSADPVEIVQNPAQLCTALLIPVAKNVAKRLLGLGVHLIQDPVAFGREPHKHLAPIYLAMRTHAIAFVDKVVERGSDRGTGEPGAPGKVARLRAFVIHLLDIRDSHEEEDVLRAELAAA